jgi:hypothetical protein
LRIYYPALELDPPDIPTGLDTDATDQLNAWAATIPNGPGALNNLDGQPIPDIRGVTLIDLTGHTYRVDGTLTLLGLLNVAIRGLTITRVTWPALTPQLAIDHCTNLILDHPNITGTKTEGFTYQAKRETETAYRLLGSGPVVLNQPRAQNIWGDHLYLGKTNRNPRKTSDVTVTGGTFGDCGRDPIAATACTNVTVTNCTFGNGRTCIDMEPNGAAGGVNGLTVTDCTFAGQYQLMFAASVSGSTVGTVENITIARNTAPQHHLQTMIGGGERRANLTITDNTGTISVGRPSGAVMNFTGCTGNLTVTGNTNPVNPNRNMRMARFVDCDQAVIDYHDNQPADLT